VDENELVLILNSFVKFKLILSDGIKPFNFE